MSNIPATPTETVWPWRRAADGARSAAAGPARRRGAVQAAIAFGVAALLWLWKPVLTAVVASIALVVLLLALASPLGGFARLERGVERFAHWVGLAVTWLLMPLLFFVVFLPVGLLLRRGRLRFTGDPDESLATYWQRREGAGAAEGWQRDRDSYGRQF